jgi:hypothetical protein
LSIAHKTIFDINSIKVEILINNIIGNYMNMESLNKALKFSDKFSNQIKVKYEIIISEMDSKRGTISKDVFKKNLSDIYKMVTNQNKNIILNINNAKRHFDSNDSISLNL